jgi:stress response protein SCP2
MVVSFGVNVGGADAEPETPPPAPTPEVATPTPTPTHHLDEDSAPSSALGSGRRITPARPPVGAWGLGPDSLTLPLGQPVVLAGTDGTPMRQLWLRVSCPQADAGATADLSAVTFDHHGAPGDVVDHVRPASRDGAVGLVNRPVSATAEATASVQLRLDAVDRALAGLVLAVSSYRGEQLSALGSIVTEVVDETGAVLVRAETPATSTSAVVLATVVRADDGAWLLTAVGSPASGRTAPSLVGAGYWALAGAVVE